MYSFDSLTLKYFYDENKDFISGSIVQKIQLPSRYEVILTIRNLDCSQNKKLYININPKYPHICFINEKTAHQRNLEIPKTPPMFCMQLRKYLQGSKIKDFRYVEYDRILEFYFDYYNEIGSLTEICLSVEFMGKYSNIILYNSKNKIILGVAHNVSEDKSRLRELYGGLKYIYPPLKNKLDILNISYATFCETIKNQDIKAICDNFYYLNQNLVQYIIKNDKLNFNFLQELVSLKNPSFMSAFWGGETVNDGIDNYFANEIFKEKISSKKNKLTKIILPQIKKYEKIILLSPDNKKALEYKQKADLIMANLYSKENIDFEIDETLSLNENAQKYYKLYKKAQKSFENSLERTKEANKKLEYFNSVLFNIENSSDFAELSEIEEELHVQKNIKNEAPKISKIEFKGFDIFIGKNNKQNDYLISKIASGEDLWFHGLNFPSSHVILKVPNNKKAPDNEVIEFCAKLTKQNSKAKDGTKASIIMTKRKNLKKPPNTYPGYVTYKNEVEIVI